jgi:Fe-S-cluster containining protein
MPRILEQLRLSTTCHTCSDKCCSQPYDWVYLTDREVDVIAAHTRLDPTAFSRVQVNHYGKAALRVLMLPCQFLQPETGKCTIYESRPLVCRLFPFYPEPMTGTMALLPAQCGENLLFHSVDSDAGWALSDFDQATRDWCRELWSDAFARYQRLQSADPASNTTADGSP